MIHVITPCTRPTNLVALRQSIPDECTWTIVLDESVARHSVLDLPSLPDLKATVYLSPHTGYSGNPNRNFALDRMQFDELDWIYILDDDNIIHPEWYGRVKDLHDPVLNMVGWGQVWKNGTPRLAPTQQPRVGHVDSASYMVRGRVMKNLRYSMEYVADGLLAEEVFTMGGYLCLNEYLAYYNWLR
jgi:hypothetical protein